MNNTSCNCRSPLQAPLRKIRCTPNYFWTVVLFYESFQTNYEFYISSSKPSLGEKGNWIMSEVLILIAMIFNNILISK